MQKERIETSAWRPAFQRATGTVTSKVSYCVGVGVPLSLLSRNGPCSVHIPYAILEAPGPPASAQCGQTVGESTHSISAQLAIHAHRASSESLVSRSNAHCPCRPRLTYTYRSSKEPMERLKDSFQLRQTRRKSPSRQHLRLACNLQGIQQTKVQGRS